MSAINIACSECRSDLACAINDGEMIIEPCNYCQEFFNEAAKKMISEGIQNILKEKGLFSYNLIVSINRTINDSFTIMENLNYTEREEYNDNHDEPLTEVP